MSGTNAAKDYAAIGQLADDPAASVAFLKERRRALRAVQVLERIGSVEARQILEELGRGVESARLAQAAKEARTRLMKR